MYPVCCLALPLVKQHSSVDVVHRGHDMHAMSSSNDTVCGRGNGGARMCESHALCDGCYVCVCVWHLSAVWASADRRPGPSRLWMTRRSLRHEETTRLLDARAGMSLNSVGMPSGEATATTSSSSVPVWAPVPPPPAAAPSPSTALRASSSPSPLLRPALTRSTTAAPPASPEL